MVISAIKSLALKGKFFHVYIEDLTHALYIERAYLCIQICTFSIIKRCNQGGLSITFGCTAPRPIVHDREMSPCSSLGAPLIPYLVSALGPSSCSSFSRPTLFCPHKDEALATLLVMNDFRYHVYELLSQYFQQLLCIFFA